MFAAREQENLIHGRQTAAASKPLNQGVKGLAPKTPGNDRLKTLNASSTFHKNGREDENVVARTNKIGLDKNAFVTPLAPRDRAPLGAKTTNAKGKAFQTPGPLKVGLTGQKTRLRSTSARKSKLKIHHQSEPVAVEQLAGEESDEDVEIEYCPPEIKELPDFPENDHEWGPDKKFPQFEGQNMFRDMSSIYGDPIGPDGRTKSEREEIEDAEKFKKMEDELDKQAFERIFGPDSNSEEQKNTRVLPRTANSWNNMNSNKLRQPLASKNGPSTALSKSAASALSSKPQPAFAAPTVATNAKKSSALPSAPSVRHNVQKATASHTTIGYSRGRQVSSTIKQGDWGTRGPSRASVDSEKHNEGATDEAGNGNLNRKSHLEIEDIFGGSEEPDWLDEQIAKGFGGMSLDAEEFL